MSDDTTAPKVDLHDATTRAYLIDQGWHHEGNCPEACGRLHCEDGDCGHEFCVEPRAARVLAVDVEDHRATAALAASFEALHRQAHPDQSAHLALCRREPCRSLPFAVADAIAKASA